MIPPCGVPAHRMGRWTDVVLGVWWCPDCGEELWLTEEADDGTEVSGRIPAGAAEAPHSRVARADPVPGVPGGAEDGGDPPRASGDRASSPRLWHLIAETFGGSLRESSPDV